LLSPILERNLWCARRTLPFLDSVTQQKRKIQKIAASLSLLAIASK